MNGDAQIIREEMNKKYNPSGEKYFFCTGVELPDVQGLSFINQYTIVITLQPNRQYISIKRKCINWLHENKIAFKICYTDHLLKRMTIIRAVGILFNSEKDAIRFKLKFG